MVPRPIEPTMEDQDDSGGGEQQQQTTIGCGIGTTATSTPVTSTTPSNTSPPTIDPTTTKTTTPPPSSSTTWFVTKYIILKSLGFVYLIAFLGAWYQNDGLMGKYGLVPSTNHYLQKIGTNRHGIIRTSWEGFLLYPSLHWLWWEKDNGNNDQSSSSSSWDHDDYMRSVILCGLTCSGWLLLGGERLTFLGKTTTTIHCPEAESMTVLALLWILYFTIVTTSGGTSFYSYGWESQLLETGFLSIFLCQNIFPPMPSIFHHHHGSSHDQSTPTPSLNKGCSSIVLWLFRWLCFRISMGAGLIKIRGDSCWTQKTCLLYHFETQPIPSPMSYIFHFLPSWMLQRAVDLDLFVQVYTSWMVLLPTSLSCVGTIVADWKLYGPINKVLLNVVRLGGYIQTGFMINIILSGNFAFLNHLTIIPALACLDDACWPQFLTRHVGLDPPKGTPTTRRRRQQQHRRPTVNSTTPWLWTSLRWGVDLMLLVVILTLSRPVVENLLQLDGTRQQMNASFDSFRLVGTYGAFGSVGKQRYEPIISIAYDTDVPTTVTVDGDNQTAALDTEDGGELVWIELEFPCKPGSVYRRPCFCAPYHYRLDWNIWFIGFKPHATYLNRRETWLYDLLTKILIKEDGPRPWLDLLDPSSAALLRNHYEQHGIAPKFAKVDMYHYRMDAPLWTIGERYIHSWLKGHKTQHDDDSTKDDGRVTWWRRQFEENLIPVVSLNEKTKRLVRETTS